MRVNLIIISQKIGRWRKDHIDGYGYEYEYRYLGKISVEVKGIDLACNYFMPLDEWYRSCFPLDQLII